MNEISKSYYNYTITLAYTLLGDDLLVQIYGGSHPHIGATVLGIYHKNENDNTKADCTLSSIAIQGHKEDILFRSLTKYLCLKLKKTCVISGGIHIDNLLKEQIDEISDITKQLCDILISDLSIIKK